MLFFFALLVYKKKIQRALKSSLIQFFSDALHFYFPPMLTTSDAMSAVAKNKHRQDVIAIDDLIYLFLVFIILVELFNGVDGKSLLCFIWIDLWIS